MTDHEQLIVQFAEVVGATPEQAKFYLEANNWDLNAAMSSFYEEPHGGAGQQGQDADIEEEREEDEEEQVAKAIAASKVATGKGKAKGASSSSGRAQGGIRTLAQLNNNDDDTDDSDEDDKRQTYFAGGEKSGVMLEGPPGKKKDSKVLVEDILKKAAQGGSAREEPSTPPPPKRTAFGGSGNRLGSDDDPPEISAGSSSPSASSRGVESPIRSIPEPLETAVRRLTFWRDGYTIEDGPLQSYTDPANQEFLKAINKGQAPIAYLNVKPGQPVEMTVAKRLDEDYVPPPKAPPKPFEGSGNRLGSVASSPLASSSSTPGSFPASTPVAPAPPRSLNVDENLPVTSIQIRLGDGTRMVARFNHTHTVNDIRGFINAANAGESSRSYVLQTSFPKVDLVDVTQTVKDAGLLNSVVLQRYV